MSSYVLNALKSVKEQLPENYSSRQLLATLDSLLFSAVNPILQNTQFLDRHLSIVAGWYTNAARRKLASLDSKENFNSIVAAMIVARTPEERIHAWKTLKLERTITFWLIQQWLDTMKPWPKAVVNNDYKLKLSCERRGCLIQHECIFQLIQKVEFWLARSIDFKQQIMEKYMRYAMLEAHAYQSYHREHNPHLVIDVNEVAQNFMLAVSKGIDKCDTDKGVLTSYVKSWLKDARNTTVFSHEYGTAFSITSSKKRDIARDLSDMNNISVSLEADEVKNLQSTEDIETTLISRNVVNTVRQLAKAADPLGLGRLVLQITETLNEDELRLLHSVKE